MKWFKVFAFLTLVLTLTSCNLFDKRYVEYSEDCPEEDNSTLIEEFLIFETVGLIEYGYDVPEFTNNDEALLYVCETKKGVETWYFGTRIYEKENIVIELDNFMVDFDDLHAEIEKYNSEYEIDISLNEDDYKEVGPLSAWLLESSDLSEYSPNLFMVHIGNRYNEIDDYGAVGVVLLPDFTCKLIAFNHNGEYIELFDLL
jgi:hypothetical protein